MHLIKMHSLPDFMSDVFYLFWIQLNSIWEPGFLWGFTPKESIFISFSGEFLVLGIFIKAKVFRTFSGHFQAFKQVIQNWSKNVLLVQFEPKLPFWVLKTLLFLTFWRLQRRNWGLYWPPSEAEKCNQGSLSVGTRVSPITFRGKIHFPIFPEGSFLPISWFMF